MNWEPITQTELEREIEIQLAELSSEQQAFFQSIRAPLRAVPIVRWGELEKVFVVAELKEVLVFYEDIEEGFEIATLNESGIISEYGSNQFKLLHVVNQLRACNS